MTATELVTRYYEIRGDRIARVTNYYDLTDWLRQVGRLGGAVTVARPT